MMQDKQKKQALGLLNNGYNAMTNNSLTKKLLELDANEQQSDYSQQLSMFGDNRKGSKKSQRPVKGYKWMIFTFFMIILLSLCVIFADEVIKQIDNAKNSSKNFFKVIEFAKMDTNKDNQLSWEEVINTETGWIKQFDVVKDKTYVGALSADGTTLDQDTFKSKCKGENKFMDYTEFYEIYKTIHEQQRLDRLTNAQEKWQLERNEEDRLKKEAKEAADKIAKDKADKEKADKDAADKIAKEKADKIAKEKADKEAAAAGGDENTGDNENAGGNENEAGNENDAGNENEAGNENDVSGDDNLNQLEFEDLDEELDELLRE